MPDDKGDDRLLRHVAKESGVASIQYYAWDGSDGASPGDTVDGTRDGETPFSDANLTANFIVTARNDVPTLTPVALIVDEASTLPTPLTAAQLPVVDQDRGTWVNSHRQPDLGAMTFAR